MRTLHAEIAAQRTSWLYDTAEGERQRCHLSDLVRWQRRRRRAAAHERLAREALTAAPVLHRPA